MARHREIGREFGVGPYVVSKAVARIGPLALSNRRVRAAITRIKSNVQM